ncbi:MAG: DNA mismatch repair protein MutS [Bdellovibrio sp.]|nr:MAG: DNA mismatch repair protein MutS [Bdellovibrio sp.]
MQQYWEIKKQHKDKILLFRMGDFFEMFHEDAKIAAPILNITLTARNKKAQDETPMCGVPYHSVATPIAKLLAAGHKVAICDQIEDPKEAKGLVRRAVTRILSPGMVYDPETLDQLSSHYLCAFDTSTVSFLETSTGEAFYYMVSSQQERDALFQILQPVEFVLSSEQKKQWIEEEREGVLSLYDEVVEGPLPESARRLLAYVSYMQPTDKPLTYEFQKRQLNQRMRVSPLVLRHLEVFKTYGGDLKGSLFYAINRTKTSSGARLLKSWLAFPLKDRRLIEERWNQVEQWMSRVDVLKKVRRLLSEMGDVERRLSKMATAQAQPSDLLSLAASLQLGLQVSQIVQQGEKASLKTLQDLVQLVFSALVDEPGPLKKGGFIRKGFSQELDELVCLAENSQDLLAQMEAREREKLQIPSLRIKYNNVFGYFIEITNTHKSKVPAHYKRKQTLTNSERYVTQELQELEDRVLSARARRQDLEERIFHQLRLKLLEARADILAANRLWAELDVILSFAWLSLERQYVRPSFSEDRRLTLRGSRHPVVEQEVKKTFVPNDIILDRSECLLLTGPNMAGKSTLMRQVAISALLAQIGCFVPAQEAQLPLFDQLFTRIGASDFLSEGLSTFMVEMKETAEMLRLATEESLVVLDEVGRGTSTYDGMSLAQSILEYLVEKKKPLTLFATHYHELTALAEKYPKIKNAHMAIQEKKQSHEMVFLYTLMPGATNKSYGIHVARLAGLPSEVTRRASAILRQLEKQGASSNQLSLLDAFVEKEEDHLSEEDREFLHLKEELKNLSVFELTPLEALNHLAQWRQRFIEKS